MSNSFLTTTKTKNTAPHIKLNDEQLNPQNNKQKNTIPHTKLSNEQLNPHNNNNKKHNSTYKAER
jgi:hypothetical protein